MSRIVRTYTSAALAKSARAVRIASLRVRDYGRLAGLPLPAGYPVGGMAGEQWRVAALHLATDHAAMISLVIVAWVLAWSRVRRGGHHGWH